MAGRIWGAAQVKTALRSSVRFAAWLRARVSVRRNWIVEKHTGAQALEGAKRVCVFVTWDKDSFVHDYLLEHLKGLQSAGFATIVVVNSKKLPEAAIARLAPLSALVVHRRNRGYDFGGYHDGLSLIGDPARYEGVLLMNDSTYGPMFDLQSHVFDNVDQESAQVWSMTDSWEDRFHLQSYFLYVTQSVLASKAWRKFWSEFLFIDHKKMVVKRYEIGFTQLMVRAGFECKALYPYRELAREYVSIFGNLKALGDGHFSEQQTQSLRHIYSSVQNGVPMNGSHFLWDRLLLTHRCPYIKRELLSHNPTGVPLNGLWDVAVRSVSTYDPDMIERHLKTITRNRSP
jgi:lipopolysaccharide biosynthesis protein